MPVKSQSTQPDPFAGLKGGQDRADIGGGSVWTGTDAKLLLMCVEALTERGDALIIGVTSDGGAGMLTVLSKGQKRRFYEHDSDALNGLLSVIHEWAKNA